MRSPTEWASICFTIFVLSGLPCCSRHEENHLLGEFPGISEYEEISVSFEVSGRVTELFVVRGQEIAQGDPIARLDDTLAGLSLQGRDSAAAAAFEDAQVVEMGPRPEAIASMKNQIAAARALEEKLSENLRREASLVSEGASAEMRVTELRVELKRASEQRKSLDQNLLQMQRGARKTEIDAAKKRAISQEKSADLERLKLALFRVTSPLTGTVTNVHVDNGEVISAAMPVVTIVDRTRPYVYVFLPPKAVAQLSLNSSVYVRFEGSTTKVSGVIEHISEKAEFTPRYIFSDKERDNLMFRVRVRIDDPGRELKAGLPVFVRFSQLSNKAPSASH